MDYERVIVFDTSIQCPVHPHDRSFTYFGCDRNPRRNGGRCGATLEDGGIQEFCAQRRRTTHFHQRNRRPSRH